MKFPRPQDVGHNVAWFAAQTPTLFPATHTNSYAIGERDVILVEPATPYPDERREWLAWAREFPARGRQLKGIFLTHHHPDHVGGAQFFSEALNVPLWAHATTKALLPDVTIARTLADGEVIALDGPEGQRWQCLHTPGHDPGHLCLVEETQGIAIVGDMVASVGTILIDPDEGDLIAYLAQLERLANIPLNLALPAHGAPIDDPKAKFEHYIAHRLRRESRVVDALAQVAQPASLDALLPHAYGDVHPDLWPLARLSLESHLIKLVRDGRLRKGDAGWSA